jgi:hypothetical protein
MTLFRPHVGGFALLVCAAKEFAPVTLERTAQR